MHPATFAITDGGILLIANGFQAVKRWDGTTAGIETAGTEAPATAMTLATSGAGAITGTYTAYQRFVDRLGNYSNLSPISNTVTPVNVTTFNFTSVPIPTSAQIVTRQILRNANGNTSTYYVDVESTNLTATSFSSTKSDATLITGTPVTVADFISQYGVPPDDLPLLCNSKSRLLMSGEAVYSLGAVSLTNGSATVTGIGTRWTSVLAGRYLYVAGNSGALISSVNTTAQTLTLSAVWTGSTAAFAEYGIRSDPTRKRLIAWSGAGLPEAVDVTDATNVSRETGAGDITAMFSMGSLVYLSEADRQHVFSFLQDPTPAAGGGDGSIFPRSYRGSANARCVVVVESVSYLLDQIGIHAFDGNSSQSASVAIDDIFDSAGYYDYRINFDKQEFFHGIHERQQTLIRWFVSMDARKYPHHCLCFDYRGSRFWIEEYALPITSSCIGTIDGGDVAFVGSSGRRVFVLADGELDGVDQSGTRNGIATSAGVQTLADTSASFATTLPGLTIDIVAGTGAGQRRVISSNTSTEITVMVPWTTRPDSASEYQLGGVQYLWRSGVFRFAKLEKGNVRGLELLGRPAATGTGMVRNYLNRSETAAKWGAKIADKGVSTDRGDDEAILDMTKSDGYWKLRLDGLRQDNLDGNRFLEVELSGVKGEDHMAFYEASLEGVVQ